MKGYHVQDWIIKDGDFLLHCTHPHAGSPSGPSHLLTPMKQAALLRGPHGKELKATLLRNRPSVQQATRN